MSAAPQLIERMGALVPAPGSAACRAGLVSGWYSVIIVERLNRTGAALIWASTTPIPAGVARRAPEDAVRYNAAARKVMDDNGVVVNDPYAVALPHLTVWLAPRSVHFTDAGASAVAKHVTAAIEAALTTQTQSQPP